MNARRLTDLALAGAASIAAAPALAAATVAIWLDDGTPVFYRSTRIGIKGEPFTLVKLRTMTKDADKSGVDTTTADDPRLLRTATVFRRTKLDEIPQLWNVLNGTMSIVGPRPNVPREVEKYTAEERELLQTKPGLSCLSSVALSDLGALLDGVADANLAYEDQIRPIKSALSLFYVRNQSFKLDAIAIALTVVAIASPSVARRLLIKLLRDSLPNQLCNDVLALECGSNQPGVDKEIR